MANNFYLDAGPPFCDRLEHIELDILLSLLEAVQRGLMIENRNLSEIRLLLLVVLYNISI